MPTRLQIRKAKCAICADKCQIRLSSGVRKWLVSNPNVVGYGVGEKISKGQPTGSLALKVYVRRKREKARVAKSLRIRKFVTIAGKRYPLDVEEVGKARTEPSSGGLSRSSKSARTQLSFEASQRHRPLTPGVGIGLADPVAGYGTLGCIVRLPDDNSRYILSCAHVLGVNGANAVVYQPGAVAADGASGNAVGHVLRSSKLTQNARHDVDAAIALIPGKVAALNLAPLIGRLSGISTDIYEGMRVSLYGASSKYQSTIIRDIDYEGWVTNIDVTGREQKYWFEDVVRCDGVTNPGDSGAPVVSSETGELVGIHFAGSNYSSWFVKIANIMSRLGLSGLA